MFFSALYIVLSFLSPTQSSAATIKQKIDRMVDYYHQSEDFHGNIEVRLKKRTIYKRSLGVANAAFNVQNAPNTRFFIASLSKQFTAALIVILAEEGLFALDDKYSKYLPFKDGLDENKQGWNTMTIRDLLIHRASLIRDVTPGPPFALKELYSPSLTLLISRLKRNHELFNTKKSGKGHYSNVGYMLLAHLAEEVTNKEFNNLLKDYIFFPLGMKSTGQFHRIRNIKYLAEGYHFVDDDSNLYRRCCDDATTYVGSHGLYSDIDDLFLWLDTIFQQYPSPLGPSAVEQMLMAQIKLEVPYSRVYAMGFYIDEVQGLQRYWHDGEDSGYLSLVSTIPEIDLKIVILGNRHNDIVNVNEYYTLKMNDEISNLILDESSIILLHQERNTQGD